MTHSIRRTERLLDLASLGSIIGGAACFARSYYAMKVLEGGQLVAGGSRSAMRQFAYFRSLSEVGLALVVLGVLIGVGSVFANRRAAALAAEERAAPPAVPEIIPDPIQG